MNTMEVNNHQAGINYSGIDINYIDDSPFETIHLLPKNCRTERLFWPELTY